MPRRQALPVEYGLAIIELQGRFYPVRIEHEQDASVHLASFAHLLWETHQRLGIPFACGPQPTQGIVSFGTKPCRRWERTACRWKCWQMMPIVVCL